MKRFAVFAALCLPAFAQGPTPAPDPTPIAEVANAVPVCSESPVCVITAISDPTAVLQFGSGAKWCQTFTASTFPVPANVNYWLPVNTNLCPYDPAPGATKTLAAQQKSTAYTVSYTLAGVPQPPMTIPALPPTYTITCTGTATGSTTLTITLTGCTAVKQ